MNQLNDTIIFWLFAAIMLVIALWLTLPPLLGHYRQQKFSARAIVHAHREQLKALRAGLDSGSVKAQDYETRRNELRADLLNALESDAGHDDSARPNRALAYVALIALPVGAVVLYLSLGSPEALHMSEPQTTVTQVPAHEAQMQDGSTNAASIEEMVGGLAAKLAENPDDGEGWIMLGRSYMVLDRFQEATDAFSKARALMGEEPLLLVDYAEAAAMANGNSMVGLPTELLDRALEIDPENQKGIWLSGFAAMQRNDNEQAVAIWQRLLTQLPENSAEASAVLDMIAQAGGHVETPAAESTAAPGTSTAITDSPVVTVTVSLDPALADQVNGSETLFIFARAVSGPPMPLAIQRRRANELPLTITLDDTMSMMPSMKLSMFPQVTVGARISRSGEAIAQPGDLQGMVSPVDATAGTAVNLQINRAVP